MTLVGLRMRINLPRNYFTNNSNLLLQFYNGSELPRDSIDWTSLAIVKMFR